MEQEPEGPRPGGHDKGRDITLKDLEAEFPGWDVWEGARGGFYAKPPTPPIAFGTTPAQLADSIRREMAAMESRWPPVSARAHGP